MATAGTQQVGVNAGEATWTCYSCTYLNNHIFEKCQMCWMPKNHLIHAVQTRPNGNVEVQELVDIPAGTTNEDNTKEWECDTCTLKNLPNIKICDACGTSRANKGVDEPNNLENTDTLINVVDFVRNDTFNPPPMNNLTQNNVGARNIAYLGTITMTGNNTDNMDSVNLVNDNVENDTKKLINFYEMETYCEQNDLITCMDHFDCTVCLSMCNPGEGITLKDCLHSFCRDCLVRAVEFSTDAEVKCPFGDDLYICDSVMQDREIKALVTPEMYQKHLLKSIKVAESTIGDTFHCKTTDCHGWCVVADGATRFLCNVCQKMNCLTCEVQHDGSCEEYKEKLIHDEQNEESQKHLEMLLKKKEVMKCPKCKVFLTKVTGCDAIKCSMCKTDICWVTRGPRWGPGGHGDYSGGCKCKLNGKKCHPQCGNCH